ncbi:MAG: hypothetical protein K0S26_824 [Bacteroidota bacterium]|jgi:hypothetical protein|nr:hypothetical protein [Bacteroidota bacterium]
MQFHLNFKPLPGLQKINHEHQVLLVGSCFSQHIGNRLDDMKFFVDTNPFGMVFNPQSIARMLDRILDKKHFGEDDVFEHNGQWICLESHSSVSGDSREILLKTLNEKVDLWSAALKTADWLTITFGTSFAYRHLQQRNIVANCHKLPQNLFEKLLLDTPSITQTYKTLLSKLHQYNPDIKIIFTVSPVKHLRDGVVENSLSKAILLQSVHQIIRSNGNCYYFPAYEIVTDDLRDYRFFESDMAHPNKQAIDYVWRRFSETYFTEATQLINDKVMQIHQAYHHRLFNKTTASSVKFKHTYYQKCVTLQAEYPYLNLGKELQYFNTFED